jgi:hypothetical protein
VPDGRDHVDRRAHRDGEQHQHAGHEAHARSSRASADERIAEVDHGVVSAWVIVLERVAGEQLLLLAFVR